MISLQQDDVIPYLDRVKNGAAPRNLDTEDVLLVCSTLMRHVRNLFQEHFDLDELVGSFVAFLAHPQLGKDALEWIASAGPIGHPDVLDAFLAHPNITPEMILEAGLTASKQCGIERNAKQMDKEIASAGLRNGGRTARLNTLRAHSSAGRVAALLLSLPDNFEYFATGYRLLDLSEPVREIAVTLLEDRIQSGRIMVRNELTSVIEEAQLILA